MTAQARALSEREQLRRQLEADAAAWQARASQAPGDAALLDKDQLRDLDAALDPATRRELGVSEIAEAFLAASRAAARRRWWPGRGSAGGALAILLILLILATPVTLLSLVGFTAALIHALGV